jgi:hypothetical protein
MFYHSVALNKTEDYLKHLQCTFAAVTDTAAKVHCRCFTDNYVSIYYVARNFNLSDIIGLNFEEETSEMLHLERGFVWC